MNINSFIDHLLAKVQAYFPISEVRYQYDKSADSHFISISPLKVYYSKEFMDFEFFVLEEFETKFPAENLCFLNDESLTKLEDPQKIVYQKCAFIGQEVNRIPKWDWGFTGRHCKLWMLPYYYSKKRYG